MIRVVLWKEYREQRMVWVVLAALSAAALLGLPPLMAPGGFTANPNVREGLLCLPALLAWTYGLISGSMLLAGERENRTLSFLDGLPGLRIQVWWAKFLAGALLLGAFGMLLLGLAAAAQLFDGLGEVILVVLSIAAAGFIGMGWGLLFSASGRSVLNVILMALGGHFVGAVAASFLAVVVSVVLALLFLWTGQHPIDLFWLVVYPGLIALSVPATFAASALVFSRSDRGRPAARLRARRFGVWSVVFWLTWRQARGFALGIAVFALLLGLAGLVYPLAFWPMTTLVVGMLCGVSAFLDEQGSGSVRFLGDQRLPLGRLWLVKVGFRFVVALVASGLALAPSVIVALVASTDYSSGRADRVPLPVLVFHSSLIAVLLSPGPYLTLWVLNGFAAGCLFGLLFRNSLSAAASALFVSLLLSAVWVPSLLAGGLQLWQVAGPPLLLLIASRLLMRAWAAGRLASRGTVFQLGTVALLTCLWIAGGLWYRVAEIPDVRETHDVAGYRASLADLEQNRAGPLVRGALAGSDGLRNAAGPGPTRPLFPDDKLQPSTFPEQLEEALGRGWPPGKPELADWLDQRFAGSWVRDLTEAADLPPGIVDDPRGQTFPADPSLLERARPVAVTLAVRGLQRQAGGDDAAFVEDLRIGLALSRNLRNHSAGRAASNGLGVEAILLIGLDRWLENLHGHPELLRQAAAVLKRHEEEAPPENPDGDTPEYLVALNTPNEPLPWLTHILGRWSDTEGSHSRVEMEALAVALAWKVPWEGERQSRILRAMFADKETFPTRFSHLASPLLRLPIHYYPPMPFAAYQCRLRAARLKIALRLYQAEQGRPAEKLDDLVPRYLSAVPLDPFDGKPFRYRLSGGEKIPWPADDPGTGWASRSVEVLPGQGVLWSVGEDRRDDGGVRQAGSWASAPGEDRIFLVPLAPP